MEFVAMRRTSSSSCTMRFCIGRLHAGLSGAIAVMIPPLFKISVFVRSVSMSGYCYCLLVVGTTHAYELYLGIPGVLGAS